MTPDVSVVMAATGLSPELTEQLTALAAQHTTVSWELVLADNSVEGTLISSVVALRELLPGLRVVPAPDRAGKGYAVNLAAASSDARDLVVVDSDDVVSPGFLQAMVDALRDAELVAGRLETDSLNPPWTRDRRRQIQADSLHVQMGFRPTVVGAALGVRRTRFMSVGGFDEKYLAQEDADFAWRLQELGVQPCFAVGAEVRYRYRESLRAIFRQEFTYGTYEPLLYREYRFKGLPRRRLRQVLGGWSDVVRVVPRLDSRSGRAEAATIVGALVGRFVGSVRHKVVYL